MATLMNDSSKARATAEVERLTTFSGSDLHDLCDAAESAIEAGGGFGWLRPPPREMLETYWKGVQLVPELTLFVARLDGVIAGSAQLKKLPKNNEAQALVGQLSTFFVAPWARGHGLALGLVEAVEAAAREVGLAVLNLDVRETQSRAIQIYEQLGFQRFGAHPRYAHDGNRWVTGFYYFKDLGAASPASGAG
jgi:ribosomal protein S18 acetylase RimI-like enzyme